MKNLITILFISSLSFNALSQSDTRPITVADHSPTSCENPEILPWRTHENHVNYINLCKDYHRIGILTSIPQATLHVKGTTKFQGNSQIYGDAYISGTTRISDKLLIGCEGLNPLNLLGNQLLKVNGGIICEEIKVQASSNWADYVFGKNYYLRPLEMVSTFIKKHKHLPGVPSAKEIEKEGITVGEMLKTQMEKIEELTLYVIDLQHQLDDMSQKLNETSNN